MLKKWVDLTLELKIKYDDAEVIKVDDEKGVYRSNKIIVTNPRKIAELMQNHF